MKTKKEKLTELYKFYELTPEDVFKSPQGWVIITRSGIDTIQAKADIRISYQEIIVEQDFVVLKAVATMKDREITSYGEASAATTRQKYLVAMAEKRAMSRVVLKLTGFYEAGAFGVDESDDFSDAAKKSTQTKPNLDGI